MALKGVLEEMNTTIALLTDTVQRQYESIKKLDSTTVKISDILNRLTTVTQGLEARIRVLEDWNLAQSKIRRL